MGRPRKASKPTLPDKTLIIDNGAYNIKAGYAPDSLPSLSSASSSFIPTSSLCHTIPNCLAKLPSSKHTFVGAQLSRCRDFAEMVFRRPVQRGQLVNWEAEREIWATSFLDTDSGDASTGLVVPCEAPHETSLLLTEAPNSLSILQSNADQVIFEEFEFAAYRRVSGPVLNAYVDVAGLFGDRKEGEGDDVMETEGEGSAQERANARRAALGRGLATSECVLVIDAGYSHTTVTPVYHGRAIQQAVRRLEIGGKLLTNHLKETLSLRQLDLTHEFHIVNEMKEDTCFVTSDLRGDLERTWKQGPRYEPRVKRLQADKEPSDSPAVEQDTSTMQVDKDPSTIDKDPYAQGIVLDYVMPDYTTRFRGTPRAHDPSYGKMQSKLNQLSAAGGGIGGGGSQDTIVTLGNERFATPELIFSPSDVGLVTQAGLPEVVMQSVRATPTGLWPALLANVLVVGGTSKLPGFVDRLYADLRPLVPQEVVLRIRRARDPETSTWEGGARLVAGARELGCAKEIFVTRQEYLENGEGWVMRQFGVEKPLPW